MGGKIFVEDKLVLDGERWGHFKLDTRATPYTMVWFSKPVRRAVPIARDFVGQDELTVSAWHTPGKELKFETNHPEFRTMNHKRRTLQDLLVQRRGKGHR